jgi:hypothetical protein
MVNLKWSHSVMRWSRAVDEVVSMVSRRAADRLHYHEAASMMSKVEAMNLRWQR